MNPVRWRREVCALAKEHGFTLHRDNHHLVFRNEHGAQVVVPSTPNGSKRPTLNARAEFRRAAQLWHGQHPSGRE